MITRIWFIFAFLVMLWSQGCTQQDRVPASAPNPKPVEIGQTNVLEVPPSQMRKSLADSYRLKPDHRFVLAFGELHYYLRGGKGEAVSLDRVSDKWLLKVGTREAGTLPDYPKFNDILDSLGGWARNVTPQYNLHRDSRDSRNTEDLKKIKAQSDYFIAPYLFTGLRLADKMWAKKEGDIEVAKLAAEMLTALYIQTPDLLEVSDILGAKALALVSLLKSFAREPLLREEVLIAHRMGYEKHAISLAHTLAEDDPVRSYILKVDERLKAQATAEGASGITRFLWFQRLAEMGDQTNWELYRKQFYDYNTAIVSTHATAYEKLNYQPLLVQTSLASLMDSMDQETVQARSMSSTMEVANLYQGKRFDEGQYKTLMANMNQYSRGPFLDKRTFSTYARSALESNLFYVAKQELQKLYTRGEADFRLAGLDPASGEFSKDLAGWYSELYRQYAKKEKEYSPDIFKNPVMLMGYRPSFFVFRLAQYQGAEVPSKALRFVSTQLDSRPSHLYLMSEIASHGLHDTEMSKDISRQIGLSVEVSPLQKLLILRDEGKLSELFAIANDFQRPLDYRLKATQLLYSHEGTDMPKLRDIYRAMVKANGESWEVREAYLEFLEKSNLHKAAEIIIRDYLKSHDLGNAGFDFLRAKVAMARIYEAEGRTVDAVKEVEGLLSGKAREMAKAQIQSLGILRYNELELKPVYPLEKAFVEQNYQLRRQMMVEVVARPLSILIADNKLEEAEKIVGEFFKDFENFIEFRALKAQLLWAKKDWQTAARLINLNAVPLDEFEWDNWIVRLYKIQNAKLEPQEAELAFEAMVREKFPDGRLVKLGATHANPPKTWQSLKAKFTGPSDDTWAQYLYKEKEESPEAALQFLTEKVSKDKRNALSVSIYAANKDDLLWSFIENPDEGGESEYVWLLRAASEVRAKIKNPSHQKALEYFYSHEGSSHYFSIGRHLLGLISEQQAYALATGDRAKCELAYFLGLKADSAGRWPEASAWYRVAAETELQANGEFQWSKRRLKEKFQGQNQLLSKDRYSLVKN